MKTFTDNIKQLKGAIIALYIILTILWIFFIISTNNAGTYEGPLFKYVLTPFLAGMTLLPILGAILSFKKAKHWGSWNSAIGKTLITLGLGLLGWAGGMIVWNYYLYFTDVQVPFPSLADFFFIMIWPLWTFSMIKLSKATGAKYGFKNMGGKIFSIILAVVSVVVSYYLLFIVAKDGVVDLSVTTSQLILNFFYPLGDVSILISAVLVFTLSYGFLGGKYKRTVRWLLLGFFINYVADFLFLFTTTNGTYFNGHISDFMYLTMMFILTMGAAGFTLPSNETEPTV